MNAPMDNGSPTPTEALRVWIWTDGQVGGPFPFPDVEALVASGEAPPGLLARIEGGEWLPWPDFKERQAPLPASNPGPQVAESTISSGPVTREEAGMGIMAIIIILLGVFIVIGAHVSEGQITSFGLGLIFIPALIYFAPLYVAWKRQHPQTLAIGVLNFVAGWTVVGWIVAIVWACTLVRSSAPRNDAAVS